MAMESKPLKSSVQLAMEKTDNLSKKNKPDSAAGNKTETKEVLEALKELEKSQLTAQKKYEEVAAENSMLESSYKKVLNLAREAHEDPSVDIESLPPSVKKLLLSLRESGGKKNKPEVSNEPEKAASKPESPVSTPDSSKPKEDEDPADAVLKNLTPTNPTENSENPTAKSAETTTQQPQMTENEKQTQANIDNVTAMFDEKRTTPEASATETAKAGKAFDDKRAKNDADQTKGNIDQINAMVGENGVVTEIEAQKSEATEKSLIKGLEGIEGDPDYADLTAKREAYLKAKIMHEHSENFKGQTAPDRLELNFQKVREAYKEALFIYAKKTMAQKIEFLKTNGFEGEAFECELSAFKESLFRTLVIDEFDLSAEFEKQNFEPVEKNIFKNMWNGWKNMKGWKKALVGLGISGGIVAYTALTGAAPIGAAIMYGGWRLLKSAASALGAGAIFKMGNSIANNSYDKHRAIGIEAQAPLFSENVEKNMANKQEFWKFLQEQNAGYQDTLAKDSKRRTIWNVGTGLAAIGTGAAIYGGLSHFDTNVHDFLYNKPKTGAASVATAAETPGGKKPGLTEQPHRAGGGGEHGAPAGPENTGGGGNPAGPEQTPPASTKVDTTIGNNGPPTTTIEGGEPPINLTPDQIPTGPSFDDMQSWASRNYGPSIDLNGMRIGDVIDPKYVQGISDPSIPGFGDLADKIAFRNKIMELVNLREAGVSSISETFKNTPITEVLQQRL